MRPYESALAIGIATFLAAFIKELWRGRRLKKQRPKRDGDASTRAR